MLRAILKFAFAMGIVFTTMALLNETAHAQATCGQRTAMVDALRVSYFEVQIGAGLSLDGSEVFELWASETTGTWTILKSTPNGISCIMAVGDTWIFSSPSVPGSPA